MAPLIQLSSSSLSSLLVSPRQGRRDTADRLIVIAKPLKAVALMEEKAANKELYLATFLSPGCKLLLI